MSSSFDNQLRRKLGDINPEDAGITFAREKVWESIGSKHQSKKLLPFVAWITHAAAIAAGIFVGIWFFSKEEPILKHDIAAKPNTEVSAPSPANDELITKAKGLDKTRSVTGSVPRPEIAKSRQVPIANTYATGKENYPGPQAESSEKRESIADNPVNAQQDMVAVRHKKVLHLADIMNENDHITSTPEIRYKSVWAKLIPEEGSESASEPESFTMAVGNLIKNKRN